MGGKKFWIVISVIAVVIVSAIIYATNNTGKMSTYTQTDSTETVTPAEQTANTSTAGAYIEYNDQNFNAAEGRRWLFFHAGWCPQCRAIEQDIKKDGVPAGVTILKVDYDSQTALKKKYGVTLQTTFVEIDEKGNEIRKFVAYDDPTLGAVIKALGS